MLSDIWVNLLSMLALTSMEHKLRVTWHLLSFIMRHQWCNFRNLLILKMGKQAVKFNLGFLLPLLPASPVTVALPWLCWLHLAGRNVQWWGLLARWVLLLVQHSAVLSKYCWISIAWKNKQATLLESFWWVYFHNSDIRFLFFSFLEANKLTNDLLIMTQKTLIFF